MLTLSIFNSAFAHAASKSICDLAADKASKETGVPVDVLRAITRAETGRTRKGVLSPWPWTVNMEGAGHWFETAAAARRFAAAHFDRGARSFDVGCFQINYRWHGQAFASLDDMFDPVENARYAAFFLAQLHREFGNWPEAAGAYHSRTPKFAERYRARFERIRSTETKSLQLADHKDPATNPQDPGNSGNVNSYPLFRKSTEPQSFGSLFPRQTTRHTSLIDLPGTM